MAKTALDRKTGLVKQAPPRHALSTTDACPGRIRQTSRRHPTTISQVSRHAMYIHVYGDLHAVLLL